MSRPLPTWKAPFHVQYTREGSMGSQCKSKYLSYDVSGGAKPSIEPHSTREYLRWLGESLLYLDVRWRSSNLVLQQHVGYLRKRNWDANEPSLVMGPVFSKVWMGEPTFVGGNFHRAVSGSSDKTICVHTSFCGLSLTLVNVVGFDTAAIISQRVLLEK